MGVGPSTWFQGTTRPDGDRVGPDSIWGRLGAALVAFVFFPIAALVAGVWFVVFQYARVPWWVPAPVGAVSGVVGVSLYDNPARWAAGHLSTSVDALQILLPGSGENGLGGWWGANGWVWLSGQFWFAMFAGSLVAAGFAGWSWFRRPKWEQRVLRPGPVLKARARKTAVAIAAGADAPEDGITVGVALDRRDPRFAGGKPGAPYGRRAVLRDSEGAGHCLVVGGSGSGKTTTMLMGARDVIRRGHGLVVVDCKGGPDVPEQIADWAAQYGRRFHHWSMFDAREPYDGPADGPGFYDPISRGDASRRKDLLIGSQRWDVEYYKTVIGDYLQTMFKVMDLVPAPEKDSFSDVADLLSPQALIARASVLPREQYPELSMALQRIGEMADQERSGINNMYARLNTLTSSIAGPWMRRDPAGRDNINLEKVARRGEVAVFSLDTSNYEETSALLAGLIVQDLKTVSSALREDPPDVPLHVCIDEFSAVDATNIYGLLAKARDARMPVTLATQALADLKRREQHFDSQVVGIVSSFLIHRANSEEDARVYAGLSGLDKRMTHRVGTENTSAMLGGLGAAAATGTGFLQEEERYRVDPGVFQMLNQGQCVMIAKIPQDRFISPVQVIREDPAAAGSKHSPALQPFQYVEQEPPLVAAEAAAQVEAAQQQYLHTTGSISREHQPVGQPHPTPAPVPPMPTAAQLPTPRPDTPAPPVPPAYGSPAEHHSEHAGGHNTTQTPAVRKHEPAPGQQHAAPVGNSPRPVPAGGAPQAGAPLPSVTPTPTPETTHQAAHTPPVAGSPEGGVQLDGDAYRAGTPRRPHAAQRPGQSPPPATEPMPEVRARREQPDEWGTV